LPPPEPTLKQKFNIINYIFARKNSITSIAKVVRQSLMHQMKGLAARHKLSHYQLNKKKIKKKKSKKKSFENRYNFTAIGGTA
jgi:hypothetical protein